MVQGTSVTGGARSRETLGVPIALPPEKPLVRNREEKKGGRVR